ncbi:CPBP family intramembrane metalloprotease domain-containing protein [Gardnerella sp. DNF01162]|uniref:CPBP family intramembrane metalloprotease domain-containing protein n=1 Tax=Gardnerella swidsinskii TaxID=2792979 RepID=A0A9X7FFW1_9BIFI|nr:MULTISPECIES: type II CAAX endopeptidase family protein [Gardnerella]NSX41307.1 CPBP family intramembrane metalloprotease [Gardnerella vaginalis]PMC55434.1 CPBP family intramembrane metalloprotease domain-containing protein [Gardnerella swidsinskii]PNP90680.1 CPBP family intramembrane metalloprotease domain-containing protein [Gardnerella sp. DNF01162]RIY30420.1 CPBP family intramembrane metalloprotease domain-containing protein [Bifidobacteriaceae bacterium NR016]
MQDLQNSWRDDTYLLARKRQGTIGMSLCVFLVVWIAVAYVLGVLSSQFVPKSMLSDSLNTLLVSDISQYLVALPIAMLIMRTVPAAKTRQFSMKFSQFGGFFAVCIPIMYIGNIVGVFLATVLSGGKAENRVSDTIAAGNMWETFIFVVILAPIVEEWLFRKQLLSRLRAYGEKRAIVFSALAFALFHMNIFQFFYAFGLGLVFGYIYIRTSKLSYSIFLHMIVNFQGSIVAMWLEKQLVDASGNMINVEKMSRQELTRLPTGFILAGIYGMFMIAMLIVGVVLLVRRRKYLVFFNAPQELPNKAGNKALYGTVGVIAFLIISILLNLLMLFV